MKLNYKKTLLVGFAFFLICTFWQAYDTIIPKILTDKFGMSQSLSGAVMALDNILALFMLPLFGAISDRCKSPRGRRTPFILIGTLCATVLFVGLSFADNLQLTNISAVKIENPTAMQTLYDADLEITTPEGERVRVQEHFTREEFTSISMKLQGDEKQIVNPEYTDYVVPARQAYAWRQTVQSPMTLVFFMLLLLGVLISMSVFRSPAVALMPDVTLKPLRSKANAIINLMGAVGGILVLMLGAVFQTGKAENALMNYTAFFCVISGIMLVCLLVFLWKVREPLWVKQMEQQSRELGLETGDDEEKEQSGDKKLSKEEMTSLLLILASVVLWFTGYNAVSSKYSVYAGKVLNMDYNTTLIIANAAAILSYLPLGMLSTRFGRKKTIMAGIIILGAAFGAASVLREGSPVWLMNVLFSMAGIGWATINVNSYPMVVELSKGSNVGRYTGFYYTASMAAQTVTPILSGMLMDIQFTVLFPYAAVFVLLSFVTMAFVRHGDAKKVEN